MMYFVVVRDERFVVYSPCVELHAYPTNTVNAFKFKEFIQPARQSYPGMSELGE
jgi:hypothetical protein